MILWEMNFVERLAAGGRFVIRYDNRDSGRTTCCPPGEPNYSLQTMAGDAVAVLDHFNIERAHIVGASMGGMITQLVGLNHADRALTLTPIMSSPAGGAVVDALNGESVGELSPPRAEVMTAIAGMDALDWSDREAVVAHRVDMFEVMSGSGFEYDRASRAELFGIEFDRARNMASTANHGLCIASTEPWAQRLGEINLPTLVIHGTDDPILPFDHGQALEAGIKGATLIALEGAGHEIPEETLDTVIPAILKHTS